MTLYMTIKFQTGPIKFKAFADDKINVTEKFKFVLERVQNIVGKGENAGYLHFLHFSKMSSELFFYRFIKSHDCVRKG